jgi:hypothetical protein
MRFLLLCLGVFSGFGMWRVTPLQAAEPEPEELVQMRLVYLKEIESVVRPIRERYLSRLDVLKRSLGSSGDARGAAAVQDEIDLVTAGALDPAEIAKFAGTWFLNYQPSGTRRYSIRSDGTVREEEHNGTAMNPPRQTRIFMKDGDFLIDFGDGAIERLSIKGSKLLSELFVPKDLYPKGTVHVRGIGRLVPQNN